MATFCTFGPEWMEGVQKNLDRRLNTGERFYAKMNPLRKWVNPSPKAESAMFIMHRVLLPELRLTDGAMVSTCFYLLP